MFDIARQIIPHCFDLFDDAMRVAPVNGFQVFQRSGFEFDLINYLVPDIELTPNRNYASCQSLHWMRQAIPKLPIAFCLLPTVFIGA